MGNTAEAILFQGCNDLGENKLQRNDPPRLLLSMTHLKIKCNSKAIDGPRHIFEMISIAWTFPKEDKEVLFKHIQWNTYFAHSEWFLLMMASDPDPSLKKRAVELILKAQKMQNLHKSERLLDLSEDYGI